MWKIIKHEREMARKGVDSIFQRGRLGKTVYTGEETI